MNQTNIPPVNQANRPLVSVGNGNQVKWGDFPVTQQVANTGGGTVTTLNGDVTGSPTSNQVVSLQGQTLAIAGLNFPGNGSLFQYTTATNSWTTVSAPTVVGQILSWNGGAWVQNSTTAPSNGNTLVWSSAVSKWVPSAITLNGDITGSSTSNQIQSFKGQTLAITGSNFPVSGSIMQYSTSINSWTTGSAPTQNGQILQWNGFAWAQSDTPAPSNGQTLIWNSSIAPTGKWTPGNITLAGEVTGSTSSTSVVKLITYTLPVTGAINGNFLYYSSTSGKWEYGGSRSGGATPSVGDVPIWNATTGWTAGPVSSTPSLSGNPTGSMFQSITATSVTSTLALVQNMASNFVNGSVTFHGSGGSNAYSLTVPTTGYYQVDGQVYIAAGTATGGFVVSAIFVNGSEVMRANSFGTGGAAPHCGGVIALNVSDYVQLYAQIQSGTAATNVFAGSLRTFVSLSLVSQ